jgi:hypothetical protein
MTSIVVVKDLMQTSDADLGSIVPRAWKSIADRLNSNIWMIEMPRRFLLHLGGIRN